MTQPDTSMSKQEHYIQVKHTRLGTYRYYGYAHVKGACCVGQGDWRRVFNGKKEIPANGALVPADVLEAVCEELDRQEAELAFKEANL